MAYLNFTGNISVKRGCTLHPDNQVGVENNHPVLLGIGVLWILCGLAINEWTLAFALGHDRLGPLSRLLTRTLDAAVIAWGILTIIYRHNKTTGNINLLLITLLSLVLSLECTLRIFPTLLGHEYANGILAKYSTKPDGIYYVDPVVKINFMIPNHRTEMYANGYRWVHQTDQLGFRNRVTKDKADIVLLGDSNIYGHGVNIDQTVGFFLEQFTGRSVVNLARQGDSSWQQAYLLTQEIATFRPETVVYFFCENDIRDLYMYQTDDELQKFIDTPIHEIRYSRRLDAESGIRLRDQWNPSSSQPISLIDALTQRSYLLMIFKYLEFVRNEKALDTRIQDSVHNVQSEDSLGWQYTKKAIQYMQYVATRQQAEFIIVAIPPFDKQLVTILRKFAIEQSLPYIDTNSLDRSDPSNVALFLPHDGHFSEKGAMAMAQLVANYLGQKPNNQPHR